MLQQLTVAGYRSLRNLLLEPGPVAVLLGTNGTGKTNVYRALGLFAAAAGGHLSRTLVAEGGMPSVLSASEAPVPCTTVQLACSVDEWHYELELGIAPTIVPPASAFSLDPVVKTERLTLHSEGRKVRFLERHGVRTVVLDGEGRRTDYRHDLDRGEAALAQLRDPARFPELAALRARMLGWRFYHQFRTDEHSPLRQPRLGTFTPVLAHDGSDLAAALRTILEDETPRPPGERLQDWIEAALPGAALEVLFDRAVFEVQLALPSVQRPLRAHEMSDGQLRLLCLLTALCSPRPPELLVLNEPETSLHPDVLPVLGRCIAAASRHTQIVLTTHSQALASSVADAAGVRPLELERRDGETRVVGRGRYE